MYKNAFDMSEEEYNQMLGKCKQVVEYSDDYRKGFEDCKQKALEYVKYALESLSLAERYIRDINFIKPE